MQIGRLKRYRGRACRVVVDWKAWVTGNEKGLVHTSRAFSLRIEGAAGGGGRCGQAGHCFLLDEQSGGTEVQIVDLLSHIWYILVT